MSCSLACCGGTAYSEDRDGGFLRNVITYPWNYRVLHLKVIFMFPLFFSHLVTMSPWILTDNCGCITSCILNFDTSLSWVVSCTLRSLYQRGNLYILWVGGWHCLSEPEAGRNTRALTRNWIPVVHPLASYYTD